MVSGYRPTLSPLYLSCLLQPTRPPPTFWQHGAGGLACCLTPFNPLHPGRIISPSLLCGLEWVKSLTPWLIREEKPPLLAHSPDPIKSLPTLLICLFVAGIKVGERVLGWDSPAIRLAGWRTR